MAINNFDLYNVLYIMYQVGHFLALCAVYLQMVASYWLNFLAAKKQLLKSQMIHCIVLYLDSQT